ncbi:Glyoxalase-like domain protein [Caulifigura coniformis]|uniref:Glyoxalase-like domain protein n=2 Tax=Caulifigura coniformis TaxID=2527983 RepID=A0A517SEH3_9PLAN|nr:Glyoxalase-like domain protein [Caulifigura coniformis]
MMSKVGGFVAFSTPKLSPKSVMKIEHVAINVPDPLGFARWYVEHLKLTVARRSMDPPYGHFLADQSGQVMLEIYGNAQAPSLDFPAVAPPALHFAFVSADLAADVKRLVAAGGLHVSGPEVVAGGDEVAMLRDPWGVCVQLVKRSQPMLKG